MVWTRPEACFGGCSALMLIVVIAGVMINAFQMSESGNYDWTIATKIESEQADALGDATSLVDPINGTESSIRTLPSKYATIQFFYEDDGHDEIFTSKNLKTMCETESKLVLDDDFENYCRIDADTKECEMVGSSIVRHIARQYLSRPLFSSVNLGLT